MSRSLGIPVKLLHEASGHIVTVELKSGELYRGGMVECEDNWNCQLEFCGDRASFFPEMTKIVGTLGPRSCSVDTISSCLKHLDWASSMNQT